MKTENSNVEMQWVTVTVYPGYATLIVPKLPISEDPKGYSIDFWKLDPKTCSVTKQIRVGTYYIEADADNYEKFTGELNVTSEGPVKYLINLKLKQNTTSNKTSTTPIVDPYKEGYDYYYGKNGKTKDYTKAFIFFKLAAENGSYLGMYYYAWMLKYGQGTEVNLVEAATWFEKSSKGCPDGQFELGVCYEFGHGVVKNLQKAVELYKSAAERGCANAQLEFSNCLFKGNGITQDTAEALLWLRKAAEKGLAKAQSILGYRLCYGHEINQDTTEGFMWLEKAANAGFVPAMVEIGQCYGDGIGVPKDVSKAIIWYERAANQGYDKAQFLLAMSYKEILKSADDKKEKASVTYEEVFNWFQKAADQGYKSAFFYMGWCYANGNGTEKDYAKAAEWYEKYMSEIEDSAAYNNLGLLYAEGGYGLKKDVKKGLELLNKAKELGDQHAADSISHIEKQLSSKRAHLHALLQIALFAVVFYAITFLANSINNYINQTSYYSPQYHYRIRNTNDLRMDVLQSANNHLLQRFSSDSEEVFVFALKLLRIA